MYFSNGLHVYNVERSNLKREMLFKSNSSMLFNRLMLDEKMNKGRYFI